MSQLMNGDVHLDADYDSGIPGYPGSRFVIDLNTHPLDIESDSALAKAAEAKSMKSSGSSNLLISEALPEKLKVLFVDDDFVLRKLFSRSLKRIAKDWDLHEASNGETALRMCEEDDFDLIFMDQYMASVEKQLLGTEAVRALRSQGVKARICGLSANDAEDAFLRAGANAFMFKPFPCEKEALTRELVRVLHGEE